MCVVRLIIRFWTGRPYFMPTKFDFDPSLNTFIAVFKYNISLKVDGTSPDKYILLILC